MTNFVLVHGAYQGGWIWHETAARLRAAGHSVFAPTLDGCAERAGALRAGITTESHGQEIASLLFYEDLKNVVLVGTSSGGMVTAAAAERTPERVGRLVFVDALALMPGERIRDIVTRPASIEEDLALGPSPEDAAGRLFAELPTDAQVWAAARTTLHPAACFREPVKLEKFWSSSWDAHVIYCTRAPNPGEAHQRRCAKALDARFSIFDADHYPMLSAPDGLHDLIVA